MRNALAVILIGFSPVWVPMAIVYVLPLMLPTPKPQVERKMPEDLRTLKCVPMSYLLKNQPIRKIHSYSRPLRVCEP